MSGIVLSASVRQNLLSLQSTASLLATTQNDLSTGNKVNTALDNPTEYFTAQGLNNRASDISNLLDGIGNGVQVLQAANTGITSLQSLVASAQSIANQVLQSPVGYSTKSNVTSVAINGATAQNLLGTGTGYVDATVNGLAATATSTAAYTNTAATAGTQLSTGTSGTTTNATATTLISALSNGTTSTAPVAGDNFIVNGITLTFATSGTATKVDATHETIGLDQTLGALTSTIDTLSGNTTNASSASTGAIDLNTGVAANLTLAAGSSTGTLAALGLTAGTTTRGGGVTTPALTSGTVLSGTASGAGALSAAFHAGDTLNVDGTTLTFVTGTAGANQISTTGTVANLLSAIDAASGNTGSGTTPSSISAGGVITLHTGTANGVLNITSSNATALNALGLGSGVSQPAGGSTPTLAGQTLIIGATGNGVATDITFGTGTGQIATLNELNSALAANNLQASISTTGQINIVTSNDAASATIGAISGTAAAAGAAFHGLVAADPVLDPNSQATRANLVDQYNNVLAQINTTSQDSSFNGINLLNGDTLKLIFNETGRSTLSIQGVTFNDAGLGLSTLTEGTDFLDSNSANNALTALTAASTTLRSEASSLGSNLSIVQIRQDFSKNLINVLQTGASNLTLADTNEEAANSQALSTRQSIAVSALALANQSQQSVLQLLR
jgi:flagellin